MSKKDFLSPPSKLTGKPRQRFRSLSTSLPDVDGNKGFDLPFNVLSCYDPIDEFENGVPEDGDLQDVIQNKLDRFFFYFHSLLNFHIQTLLLF